MASLGGESVVTTIQHLEAVRYLTLAGFTVLLYDVTLTLKEEVEIIWSSRKWTWVKIAYLLNRYGASSLAMFYLSFLMPLEDRSDSWVCISVTSSILDANLVPIRINTSFQGAILKHSTLRCKTAASIDMVLDVSIETLGNAIVLYELIVLWATRKRVAILMATGFVLLHSATIVSLGIAVKQIRQGMGFVHIPTTVLRTCFATVNPTAFKGVYIPAVALDIYAFVLLLINALSRPRSASQRLLDLLWGDGALFFLTTFSMRMMCLIINLVAPVGSYLALPHECWLICDQLLLPAIGSAIVVRPWPQLRECDGCYCRLKIVSALEYN